MDGKDHSDEVSAVNEEHVTGQWRKGNHCYKVAKHLAKLGLCSSVFWKIQLIGNKIGYLAEAISKQSSERVAWLLLAIIKCEKRNMP